MDDDDQPIPLEDRPHADAVDFDLQTLIESVVGVRAEVPETAFSARPLGTERTGSGIVIGRTGLVLTIGYLITEASSIWVITNRGMAVPGHVMAYDQVTGFGLVQALGQLETPAVTIGVSHEAPLGSPVTVIGRGGIENAMVTTLAARREFAGYWEYLIDDALFTVPAHPRWSGTALVDGGGRLIGVGSLLVQTTMPDGDTSAGNMFVPTDLLLPILDELLREGRANRPPRPWLGVYTVERDDHVEISGVADGSPAATGGLEAGDVVVDVDGAPVGDLAELYRQIWGLGAAGVGVPLTVLRDGQSQSITVVSGNREDFLWRPPIH